MITRPMLAVNVDDVNNLRFPAFCTPKLDGIRCLIINGKAVTRKFKPIPNHYIRETLEATCPDGFDGEILMTGLTFNQVQSLVMTEDKTEPFEYHIFDYVKSDLNKPYIDRMKDLHDISIELGNINGGVGCPFLHYLFPVEINNIEELNVFEEHCLINGYEGCMTRIPSGKYKCGRSTMKEQLLLKIKRFNDAEAIILNFEEKLHNTNVKEVSELGLSKRASNKENLIPANTLGSILVQDITNPTMFFSIGSGFDDELRQEIWNNKHKYIGKTVTYKSQPSGAKDLPRFPVFKGFRDSIDM